MLFFIFIKSLTMVKNMKKHIILVLAISALSSWALAREADRGAFEGVSAEDIRRGDVSTQEILEKMKANSNGSVEAEIPQSGHSTVSLNSAFSSLGANYVQVGAAADFITMFGSTETGVDARLGLNLNLYKQSDNSGLGVDLSVPLEYMYIDASLAPTSMEVNTFSFPVYLRPYYAFEVTPNFVIKPFVQAGVGGKYSDIDVSVANASAWADGFAFTWAVGGGVEFCIYKDFYIQGRYLYNDSNAEDSCIDDYITPEHEISAEIGYRLTDNLAIVVQYSHVFWNGQKLLSGVDMDQDKVGACLRIMF